MRILLPGRAHAVPAVPQDVPREVVGVAAPQSSSAQSSRATQTAPYQDDKHLKRKQSGMFVDHFLVSTNPSPYLQNHLHLQPSNPELDHVEAPAGH